MVKVAIGMGVVVLAIVVLGLFPLGRQAPDVNIPQSYEPQAVDMTVEDLEAWVNGLHASGYNVDVKVGSHAWQRHGVQATEAIKCLTNNGTTMVLSEKNSRNLHLICIDPQSGSAYVAVIEKIRRYADTMQNASSKLITAFKLENVTVEQYVAWETQIKAIAVRLTFAAGELFFQP